MGPPAAGEAAGRADLTCGWGRPARLLRAHDRPCLFPPCLEQQLDPPQKERLTAALAEMDQQLRKLADTPWLCQPVEPGDEEVRGHRACACAPGQWLSLQSLNSSALCSFGIEVAPVWLPPLLCQNALQLVGRSWGWIERMTRDDLGTSGPRNRIVWLARR